MAKRIFYAHSGGVTPTINAIAASVIRHAKASGYETLVGQNGIVGLLEQKLIKAHALSEEILTKIFNFSASAFGSARFKLPNPEADPKLYAKIIALIDAHQIDVFIYNGGNDSQDTTLCLRATANQLIIHLKSLVFPKPSIMTLLVPMCVQAIQLRPATSPCLCKKLVLTLQVCAKPQPKYSSWKPWGVMPDGSQQLVPEPKRLPAQGPHIVLVPEVNFNQSQFLAQVNQHVATHGYCCIAASEGLLDANGELYAASETTDAFGHRQLGGVAHKLAHLIQDQLKFKTHVAVVDYLQRAARHQASQFDLDTARSLGQEAITKLDNYTTPFMLTIKLDASQAQGWTIQDAALDQVANFEKVYPKHFMTVKICVRLLSFTVYPPIDSSAWDTWAESTWLAR